MVRRNKKNEVYLKKSDLTLDKIREAWIWAEHAYAKDQSEENLKRVRLARTALEAKEAEERSK